MNNKNIYIHVQFGFRIIWRIKEISEGVICNISPDLRNSSDDIQREWMEPPPEFFDMLQYFETILTLVESLWSS